MYSILVIDDEESIRAALSRVLNPEGYTVSTAVNLAEGFDSCARNKPDLVILDVNLPDGYGIDLCRKIKSDPKLRHIPVFMLTGESIEVENRLAGLEAGADDYILKPFNPGELIFRIKRILRDVPKRIKAD
ncbi:MAG TPA: response regulator [Elusimicrobiales bacterium]|nr:response regulator [Elusimicrobiales bacterium]